MPLKFMRFKHKTNGKVCHIPAGRYGNFLNVIKKIVNYVRYNIAKHYIVHLTLTLKEAAAEIDFKHFHRVIQFIDTRLKRADCDFVYVAVKEIQKERLEKYGEEALHYHVLCIYSKPYVFPRPEEIAKSWKLGNVDITAPKIRLKLWKIVNYIGKYIGKGYEFETLNFKKSFTASQIKQIYKLREDRLRDVVIKYGKEKAESFKCTYRKIYACVYEKKQELVFDEDGFLDKFIGVIKCIKKELVMEFPSEWVYEGIYYEPF